MPSPEQQRGGSSEDSPESAGVTAEAEAPTAEEKADEGSGAEEKAS